MSLYWFTVLATFILIIVSETYRCRRMPFGMIMIHGAVSLIPGINVIIAVLCVYFAINK